MKRPCEVCSGLTAAGLPKGDAGGRMQRVVIEERTIALCARHSRAVADGGITTMEELCAAFVDAPGGRSLIDRRSPLDRRHFPPRPEGRRRMSGRRMSDPVT